MKKILLLPLFALLLACNSNQKNNAVTTKSVTPEKEITAKNNPAIDSSSYEISVYDNPKLTSQLARHKESLKLLADKNIFEEIHKKLLSKLTEQQQSYFNANPNYNILSVTKGNLFKKNDNDCAFLLYDKKNIKTSILIYNDQTKKYAILYKDLKVKNDLKNSDCYNANFGTLDYVVADEWLVSSEDALLKSTEYYLESAPIKITDLSKDENFALSDGCFAKKHSKTNVANSLCVSTSSVYNNWDCLQYDDVTNTFTVFYSQAFAD